MSCRRVGLTGGIASGKTTVSRYFRELGVPVLDADELSRELVQPGQAALAEIVAHFGAHLLQPDGGLDRAELRRLIFADAAQRRRLENILHPRVRALMESRAATLSTPYCLLSVPLLVETGQTGMVERVLVVDCSEAVQRQRLGERDNLSEAEIQAVLAAQCDRQTRLAHADDVLGNDSSTSSLRERVAALHQEYLQWAGEAVSSAPSHVLGETARGGGGFA